MLDKWSKRECLIQPDVIQKDNIFIQWRLHIVFAPQSLETSQFLVITVRKHNIQKTVERLWAGSECVLPSCFIQGFLMPPKKRTRLTTFMHLSNLLGTGRDLLPSELPTLRDILRYGLLLREQSDNDTRNYSVSDLAKDIYPANLEKWKRANDLFKQPVINSRRKCWIKRKLHHEAWQTFWHS